jgi:4-diphosphocytidyl-2-C-methyl-D-erythritol kinase
MTSIREFAPAKINLTLGVAGRRPDGYHEIASLVAFANAGDEVAFDTGAPVRLTVSGPFAGSLAGTNILERALALIQDRAPQLAFGSVRLEKHLPVAAGIGGGSADAGALLRAVRRANGVASASVDWSALACALGADVPVCLEARPLWMTGTGGELMEIAGGLPPLEAVLINPMADVPADKTARVFGALGAGPRRVDYAAQAAPRFPDRAALIDFMRAGGNDLAVAAEHVVPEIGDVTRALGSMPGIEYAAVSGAGPTCFGIFPDRESAEVAREQIAAKHPGWWVAAVTLG